MAELGVMVGKSSGEYMYLRLAYADWVGYIWAWTIGILYKPSSEAVLSLTCAEYALVPFYQDSCGEPPMIQKKLLASCVIRESGLTRVWRLFERLIMTSHGDIYSKLIVSCSVIFSAATADSVIVIFVILTVTLTINTDANFNTSIIKKLLLLLLLLLAIVPRYP